MLKLLSWSQSNVVTESGRRGRGGLSTLLISLKIKFNAGMEKKIGINMDDYYERLNEYNYELK